MARRHKLENARYRADLLNALMAGSGVSAACAGIGIGRTSLHRYRKAHPEFDADVTRAQEGGVVDVPNISDPVAQPSASLEAVIAEVIQLGAPRSDQTLRAWDPHDIGDVITRFASIFDSQDAHITLKVMCGRAIFMRAAAVALASGPGVEQVIVEVVAKDPLPEAADG